MSFLKSQKTITIIATTMRIPTQTPALNIPPITSQLVIVNKSKVKMIVLDLVRFFMVEILVCAKT